MNQAAIFDMDGVICHTNPYHAIAFRKFFSKRNMFPTDEDFALHMYGKNNRYIMSHFFEREITGDELAQLEEEKESLFREIYRDQIQAIDGLIPFLEELKAGGYRIGVATSAPRLNLELISDHLNLTQYVDCFLSSEDVSKHKPDPEVYLKAASILGVHPERCIVFEDSHSGVTAGLNAGMTVVAVLSTHRLDELPPSHYYIRNFEELDLHKTDQLLESLIK